MLYGIILIAPLIILKFVGGAPLTDQACDINARNESCPDDFCCVRDEFLYSETYCRQYGKAQGTCSTKPSQFECPCEPGYQCATNIHGHVTSLFGKCYPISGLSTDSVLDSVTSDLPNTNNDATTADNNVNDGGTTVGYSKDVTTNDVTGHTKHIEGEAIIG